MQQSANNGQKQPEESKREYNPFGWLEFWMKDKGLNLDKKDDLVKLRLS